MKELAKTIIDITRSRVHGRLLNVGLFYRGELPVAQQLLAEGHRTIVLSDRFHKLHAAYDRFNCGARPTQLLAEADLKALPISNARLDLLILSCGLPSEERPVFSLKRFRKLLKPGGLLVWPHPVKEGVRGHLSRIFDPWRLATHGTSFRRQLCEWTMAAGFANVSQFQMHGEIFPWVVTTGEVGERPWEIAS